MPQTVYPTNAAVFGAAGGANTLLQTKSVSTKMDKKDGRDMDGNVIAYAYYGKMAEHSLNILGIEKANQDTVASSTAPSALGVSAALGGTAAYVIDEVSVDYSNEDFTKTNIKVSEYLIED